MAKTLRKALIAVEDLNTGVGTFNRGTSTGGTQSLTKISALTIGYHITSVSSTPYSAAISDGFILVNAASSAITINLPAAAAGNSGKALMIKKTDSTSNAVTLDGSSTQTIDGALTYVMSLQYEVVTIVSDGSNWHIAA